MSLINRRWLLSKKARYTWDDAVSRWLVEQSQKATIDADRSNIRWLNTYLSGVALPAIDRDLIDSITREKLHSGVTNATVNRALALLRSILRRAASDWEWLPAAPKVRLLREPVRRVRYLSRYQASVLISELPGHLADMAVFSLATGLRRANVTGLEWSQVDLDRRLTWVHPDQAKMRKAIAVPLNADALRVVLKQSGKHPLFVFTYRGRRVNQVTTAAWYKALKRAGISDFRWHDLRHTWASWHVQGGTPLYAVQELGGWESTEMVRRYAHLSADHLAVFADKLRIADV